MTIWGVGPDAQAVGLMITNRRITAGAVVLLWAGLSIPSALGNGFRLAGQDAFVTSRGEAFVATADNASAVYYNPAGLAQLHGGNLRAGGYGIYLDPTFKPPSGATNSSSTYHIDDKYAAVPQCFVTYTPETFPVSLGLGAYAPYGGNVSWPQDTGFRTVATDGSLTYLRINPVVAVRLGERLSIGGGLMVDYADLKMEQGLIKPASPLANYFRFEGDGWTAGYNLGVLWRPHDKLSLGATFRSSTTFDLEGHTEFELQPLPGLYPATRRSADISLEFPWTAVWGISFRPTPRWNLEFNADYTHWSSFDQATLHQATPPWPLQQNVLYTFDWQSSWMYEFGVTRYFDNGWHVSAGYVFSENSVPDDYYSPLVVDMDRHFFSVGAGFSGKRFSLDVAYQFGYGPSHKVSSSSPPSIPGIFAGENANGKYTFISHVIFLTAGLRF